MSDKLTLTTLENAVAGDGVAFRCKVTLQPAAGEGTKVFPPTYAGAVYATEKRRLPNRAEPVECVLLDSVQSQANRMEEALQQAIDEGRLQLPLIEVDFTKYYKDGETGDNRLRDPVGKVSSLQVPHRIADAILRDSTQDGTPFRESEIGKRINRVSARNATALFEFCPTALVFGMWDSTGPKGGLGAKFERAMVAEIVGIDAVFGVKTSSRMDPLGIQRGAGPLYRRADGQYTLDPKQALDEIKDEKPTGRKVLYKRNSKGVDVFHDPKDVKFADQGRPSEANHGNVTPDIDYRKDQNRIILDEDGRPIPVGGVTISHAEQTIVLSLPALRRLRFPVAGGDGEGPDDKARKRREIERDNAARTVLAALGLCAATLAAENGLDLRSRCLLWPTEPLKWQLLGRPGQKEEDLVLDSKDAIEILSSAVKKAKGLGLPWREEREEAVVLQPSDELVRLVVKSQNLAAQQGGDAGEGGE